MLLQALAHMNICIATYVYVHNSSCAHHVAISDDVVTNYNLAKQINLEHIFIAFLIYSCSIEAMKDRRWDHTAVSETLQN